MSWKIKIRILIFTLMTWFVGVFPVLGQIQILKDGSTIFPIFENNLVLLDSCGRLEGVLNSRGGLTTFLYDDAGNLSKRTAADLKVTDYNYDTLDRLTSITNESVEVATFDHDPNENVIEATSPLASTTFGYDEMNQLISSTSSVYSVSSVVKNQYDLNGNRTNIVYPGGLTVGYEFGADNRLESVTTEYSGNTKTISFGYDTANRLDGISYPNGVNSTFGLDAEGRVIFIKHGSFVDRTIQRNELGFKKIELIDAGLKTTVPDTRRSIKTHNDADQLTSEWVQQGTNECTVTYEYSSNGCLTSSVSSVSSVVYDYDYDNRISSTTEGTEHTEYLYDATGARIGRIAGGSPATVATNYFVIDYTDGLKRPLAETDASGTITRFYVWSGSQLLCHIEAVAGVPDLGSVRYYHSDELGSTLALTDSNGDVTDEFAYMPYGYATHTAHLGSSDTPFLWLGGYGVYYDSDTDLHLALHRAYSFSMKCFIHPDPLGIDGGVNVYAMANRNPLSFIDPYGLCADQPWYKDAAGYAAIALDFVLPDARITGVEVNGGFIGSMGAGGQLVENYRSGEVSLFGYGSSAVGMQLGDVGVQGGLIWNSEQNADYAGGFHSVDAGFSFFGATLSLPGDTRLNGGEEWNVQQGAWAITGGVGLSFTPILRIQDSEYSQPKAIPMLKPRTSDTTGKTLYMGHAVLRWLEEKSE